MPVIPSDASREFTDAPPPAIRSTMSVALLSEISSISSSRLCTESWTPGSLNRLVSVPLPGCRSDGFTVTIESSRTVPA